jgi:predicted membrane channel-forming protein YqfA (hemolysin III family)
MIVGVVCGLFYILASLYQGPNIFNTLSTALLYVGIVSLIAGIVFYGLAGVRRVPSRRRY